MKKVKISLSIDVLLKQKNCEKSFHTSLIDTYLQLFIAIKARKLSDH